MSGFSGYVGIDLTRIQAEDALRTLDWLKDYVDGEDIRQPVWLQKSIFLLQHRLRSGLVLRAERDAGIAVIREQNSELRTEGGTPMAAGPGA